MTVMGRGNWKFLLEMGRGGSQSQEWEGGFIMGVWRFLKSLYIVGRPVLPPIFMKTPL